MQEKFPEFFSQDLTQPHVLLTTLNESSHSYGTITINELEILGKHRGKHLHT
jgi:hypothetical protein